MIKFDLHFHSTYSDGKLSVPELAKIIRAKKLDLCALTDHNTIDGIRELEARLVGSGIRVIPGVELTAKYNEDEIHVLALDFDIDLVAKILKERNELVRHQKIEEMKKAIKLSRREGFEITDGLVPVEKQPVTLTIALDICARQFNQDLFIKRHAKRFIPEDIYYEYQAPGKSCAVERSGVTADWIVEKFKGVARDLIIAHPFVSVSVVTKPLDEARMKDLLRIGMTGIEMYHSKISDEQISLIKKIVKEKGLHYTGGSDFHGRKTDPSVGQYGLNRTLPDFFLSNYASTGRVAKNTPNALVIQKVTKALMDNFQKFKPIQSAYIYGSVLTKKFHKKSDIDVMFIVEDITDRCEFLKRIKTVRASIKDFKLDINIVFRDEFRHLWHIFRPPTFFVWIKQRNILLWGADCLRDLKENEITVKTIYKRAVDLAQGCRAVYLNDKDVAFWEIKYSRWLRELQYGMLYLHGEIELDSELCGKKLCKAFSEVKQARLLSTKDRLPIKSLSEIAETFVLCIERHFIKKL